MLVDRERGALMERITKWAVFLVSPAMAVVWASIIAVGIVAGLRQWPGSEAWLADQSRFFTFAIYFACWFAAYVVAFICVANIAAPIHYAVDPAYATERAHKRRVKQLQVGQRIRVADAKGENHATITRIDRSGEFFDVTWDDDGHTNTLSGSDMDIIELMPRPPPSRSRAGPIAG